MDSLNVVRTGGRNKLTQSIRWVLEQEWKSKKGSSKKFDHSLIPDRTIIVPRQDNNYDCGLFLIKYVECFLQDPGKVLTSSNKMGKEFLDVRDAKKLRIVIKKKIFELWNQIGQIVVESTSFHGDGEDEEGPNGDESDPGLLVLDHNRKDLSAPGPSSSNGNSSRSCPRKSQSSGNSDCEMVEEPVVTAKKEKSAKGTNGSADSQETEVLSQETRCTDSQETEAVDSGTTEDAASPSQETEAVDSGTTEDAASHSQETEAVDSGTTEDAASQIAEVIDSQKTGTLTSNSAATDLISEDGSDGEEPLSHRKSHRNGSTLSVDSKDDVQVLSDAETVKDAVMETDSAAPQVDAKDENSDVSNKNSGVSNKNSDVSNKNSGVSNKNSGVSNKNSMVIDISTEDESDTSKKLNETFDSETDELAKMIE